MSFEFRDPVRLYIVLRFATAFAMATAFTTSAIYRIDLAGLSPLQLVLVGTVLELSVFLFEVPTGVVADTYSRRLSLIVGLAIIAAGLIVEGSIASFGAILVAQVIWGIGYTFTSGATEAWLMDEAGERRGEHALLRAAQVAPVGALSGIALGAGLAAISLRIPYVVGGAALALVAAWLLVAMRETTFTPAPPSQRGSFARNLDTFRHGLATVRGRTVLVLIMAISVGHGLWNEAFDRLWELQFLQHWSFPGAQEFDPVIWFGIINAAGLLLGIAVIEGVRRLTAGRDAVVLAATLGVTSGAMAVALAAFALAGSFALGLGAYLSVRVIYRMQTPLTAAWINRGLESRVRATVLSLWGQMGAIGQVAGGPAVGLIGSLAGVRTALAVASLILLPVVWLYALAVRATRAESRKAPAVSTVAEQFVE